MSRSLALMRFRGLRELLLNEVFFHIESLSLLDLKLFKVTALVLGRMIFCLSATGRLKYAALFRRTSSMSGSLTSPSSAAVLEVLWCLFDALDLWVRTVRELGLLRLPAIDGTML